MDKRPEITDYLFGELQPEQRSEFERELAADPQLAAEVNELTEIVTRLEELPAEAWEDVQPPPLRLNESIANDRDDAAASPKKPSREKGPGFFERFFGGSMTLQPGVALAGVALVFGAGLGIGLLSGASDNGAPSLGSSIQQASLTPVGAIDPAANGSADLKKNGLVIRIRMSGLKPSGKNDFYEAWLMDPKNGFVGIGTFRVGSDGKTTLDLPVPVGTKKFPIVDISLQPANGKPTHSGVSVLRGTLN